MTTTEKFSLKWNDFQDNICSTFGSLREDTDFADVTLACEDGQQVEAHKVILAASSPFFQNLLKKNKHAHPLIYMRGVKSEDLVAILDFLYHGEANIYQENLDTFLAIAEELKLNGLTGGTEDIHTPVPKQNIKRESKKEHNGSEQICKDKPQTQDEEFFVEKSEYVEKSVVLADPKVTVALQDLDEKIFSLMSKGNANFPGAKERVSICNVCGKKGNCRNIKDHIEANHIDGVSHSCSSCEKTFRSRPSLRVHKSVQHKHD